MPSLFRYFERTNEEGTWEKVWNLEKDLYWEFSARARELHGAIDEDWDILFAMQQVGRFRQRFAHHSAPSSREQASIVCASSHAHRVQAKRVHQTAAHPPGTFPRHETESCCR
jgi:hypothetical protein